MFIDYPNYANMSTEYLQAEYLELNKARFNSMFGHSAAQAQARVAKALHSRGITHIPNIFGDIEVRA